MDKVREIMAVLIAATRIITGKIRVSYAHLLEPNSFRGAEAKYGASIIILKLEDGEPLGRGPVSAAEFGIKTETAFEDFFK